MLRLLCTSVVRFLSCWFNHQIILIVHVLLVYKVFFRHLLIVILCSLCVLYMICSYSLSVTFAFCDVFQRKTHPASSDRCSVECFWEPSSLVQVLALLVAVKFITIRRYKGKFL